jgi:hypothetical protein
MKTNRPRLTTSPAGQTCLRAAFAWCLLPGIVGLWCATTFVQAQTRVHHIDYEWSDSVTGPWTKPPGDKAQVLPNGSLLTLSETPEKYYRLSIKALDVDSDPVLIQVADLSPEIVSIATDHIQWVVASQPGDPAQSNPDGNSWTNAMIHPIAIKVFDLAYRGGTNPAFIEFKIVSSNVPPASASPITFLSDNERLPVRDLGHILVSLHDGDTPVPEFSEDGSTPCEELLSRVGPASNLRILRFGPTFATVENEAGELLANAGTDPFMVPHDFLIHKDSIFEGEYDSERVTAPQRPGDGGPAMATAPYASYADFKQDYLANPVYQEMRNRKARAVAAEWTFLRGGTPTPPGRLTVAVGDRLVAFRGEIIERFFLDDDEDVIPALATVNIDTVNGGLLLTGNRVGTAPLTVKIGGVVSQHELQVIPSGPVPQNFTPGWQPARYWNAGGWSEQPRYHQTTSGILWCPKVGCGPVAWAILAAWWDQHGVPAAFYAVVPDDLTVADSPNVVTQGEFKMIAVYQKLHDLCDVSCWPNGAGATAPGDMVEADSYFWLAKIWGHLGYSYAWSWDLTDPDWNQPSSYARTALKKGRPAILGLGWLWHYVVAYRYRYQPLQLSENGPIIVARRYFACNEGWGKTKGAWYSGNDTFLGAYIKPYQKFP